MHRIGNILNSIGQQMKNKILVNSICLTLMLITACGSYKPIGRIDYPIDESLRIEYHDESYQLIISDKGKWTVGRSDLTGIDFQGPTKVEFDDPLNFHKVYHFSNESGEERYVSNRMILVDGVANVRDLGGLQTENNEQIKWGKIYRSSDLTRLTKKGYEKLLALGVGTVIDIRNEGASIEQPISNKLGTGISIVSIPMETRISLPISPSKNEPNESTYQDIFTELPVNTSAIAAIIDLLTTNGDRPILIQDRDGTFKSGLTCAILLAVLDVPEETIYQEFISSNYFNYQYIEKMAKKNALVKGIPSAQTREAYQVREDYLRSSFDIMSENHGNIKNFLIAEAGISAEDLTRLKELFLY